MDLEKRNRLEGEKYEFMIFDLFFFFQDDNSKFVYSLIPEAVLCIKASNEKARSAAYTLLVVIGEALQRWHTDLSTEDIVREFLKVVLAGLAGSPSLVYCTLLVISFDID